MGAWGYGYKQNDNYFNMAAEFTEPLMEALNKRMAPRGDVQDLRAHLMWTANVLMDTEEEVSLSDYSLVVLRGAVRIVREESVANAASWREPDEYREAVEKELLMVEDWLDSFEETGFLEDRIGSLMDATWKGTNAE